MTEVVTPKTIDEKVEEYTTDNTISPTTPVDISIGEAGSLHQYATEDKVPLLARGLNPELIDELIPAAKFLQEKQSAWTAVYQSALTSTQQWEEKIDQGRLLQRELKNDFQFAYRNHPEILVKLKQILEGNSNIDLVQDLSDYPAFANQHPQPLTAINFDVTKIERSKQLSIDLLELMNQVDGVKNSKNRPEKTIRDQAYTYLKHLVDEIRDYGKYAFWNNEEKQKRYTSEYIRSKNKRNEGDN